MSDRDKITMLLERTPKLFVLNGEYEAAADFLIDNDVAAVVRCKDCKHWRAMDDGISWHNKGRLDGQCEMLYSVHCAERALTGAEHFCSYGERK